MYITMISITVSVKYNSQNMMLILLLLALQTFPVRGWLFASHPKIGGLGISRRSRQRTAKSILGASVDHDGHDRYRDFRPTLSPGFRDWKRSKRILRPSDIEVFEYLEPSFFVEVASIVC